MSAFSGGFPIPGTPEYLTKLAMNTAEQQKQLAAQVASSAPATPVPGSPEYFKALEAVAANPVASATPGPGRTPPGASIDPGAWLSPDEAVGTFYGAEQKYNPTQFASAAGQDLVLKELGSRMPGVAGQTLSGVSAAGRMPDQQQIQFAGGGGGSSGLILDWAKKYGWDQAAKMLQDQQAEDFKTSAVGSTGALNVKGSPGAIGSPGGPSGRGGAQRPGGPGGGSGFGGFPGGGYGGGYGGGFGVFGGFPGSFGGGYGSGLGYNMPRVYGPAIQRTPLGYTQWNRGPSSFLPFSGYGGFPGGAQGYGGFPGGGGGFPGYSMDFSGLPGNFRGSGGLVSQDFGGGYGGGGGYNPSTPFITNRLLGNTQRRMY